VHQDITDPALGKALAHPLRPRILVALAGRTASPSELAEQLDVPLGVLSYHVRRLVDLGLLRLVRRVPRRGAVEHYYTAADAHLTRTPVTVDAEGWRQLSDELEALRERIQRIEADARKRLARGENEEQREAMVVTMLSDSSPQPRASRARTTKRR
jgi:DNA-binding transcriptional ArsR family regulator